MIPLRHNLSASRTAGESTAAQPDAYSGRHSPLRSQTGSYKWLLVRTLRARRVISNMALQPGTRLGPYGIVLRIGSGGVRVDTRTEFATSPPVTLFPTNIPPTPETPEYGVTSDGQRFLGLERVPERTSFAFLLNWLNAD